MVDMCLIPIVESGLAQKAWCVNYAIAFYLVTFAHKISGTVIIAKPLSAFRMHQQNNASLHPALGGPHLPGYFPEHLSAIVHREIARHVISRYDRLNQIIGWWICKELIQKGIPRKDLFKETEGANNVRLLFGKKRDFMFKYGLIYPLPKKV